MRNGLLASGLVALALGVCSAAASAHGGQYKGPSDTVPPGLGGGGDTTPPGNPGGPGTPGPGAPTTGGPRGPATGGPPTAPGGGGGIRGGIGGATKRNSSEGFERWEFWWEHNKDPFLQLKARLGKMVVRTGSGGGFLGRKTEDGISANRPSPSDIKSLIVPVLLDGLKESQSDVVDSAALALGRSVRAEDADKVLLDALKNTLGHKEKTAREAAALALGVLGSQDSIETLRGLLNDSKEARTLTQHPEGVEELVRAFSAASLGLLHAQSAVPDLKNAVNDSKSASLGIKGMAILALGMMEQNQEDIVAFLLSLMQDHSLNNIVKAQAPIALGRLAKATEAGATVGHQALGPKLLPLFQDDKIDNDLRRSLAICIGMIGTVEDPDAIEALMNAVASAKDDQTRYFSMMALAEIGAKDQEPAKHNVHAKLKDFFVRELTSPKHITHTPYGALGYAVYARNEKLAPEIKQEAIQKLQDAFNQTTNPSYQGAMAIALGLLDAQTAGDDLWKRYEESNDPPLKGYIAVSLGLMRVTEHKEALREEIKKKGLDQKFRLQLARALGLMSDADALPALLDYLQNADTLAETSSAAQAVGLIGDKSAVNPLIELATNKSKQPMQRGFAEVALGLLAEKTPLPWYVVFSVDANYRAKVNALSEILDIL
jgi:HEAT repeat protein